MVQGVMIGVLPVLTGFAEVDSLHVLFLLLGCSMALMCTSTATQCLATVASTLEPPKRSNTSSSLVALFGVCRHML